jgi:7-cyano-7-deazaguanine reductase
VQTNCAVWGDSKKVMGSAIAGKSVSLVCNGTGRYYSGLSYGVIPGLYTPRLCSAAYAHSASPKILSPMPSVPNKDLETFDNPQPGRDYTIRIEIPEFTCLCPKTGQPDFATILIEYVPNRSCVELKSLKLYIWSFREEGAFHEAVTNRILDDLVRVCAPNFMRVTARFNVRGGIYTTVVAEHRDPAWEAPRLVNLP